MDFLDVGGEKWEHLAKSRMVVHMGHNCNQLELDPSIHQAMVASIEADEYRNYTPPYGFEELQALMKADVGVEGVDVMVTQGATEAIFQAMSTVLQPGDQVIVSDPGWPHIGNFARQLGAEVIEIPIYEAPSLGKLSAELVKGHMTARTKLVAVVDPLNPLGTTYSERDIQELCKLADKTGSYLLHDATYRDFATAGHFPAIRYTNRAIMNISLSKICGFAGLRVGATLAHPQLLQRIHGHQVNRLGGNWVAQRGAIAAYETKDAWRPKVLQVNRLNQEILYRSLEGIAGMKAFAYPSAGNFLAVDVAGTGSGAEQLVASVLRAGFVIRSGGYTSKRFGDRFVRITTTVPTDHMELFCKALPAAVRGQAAVL